MKLKPEMIALTLVLYGCSTSQNIQYPAQVQRVPTSVESVEWLKSVRTSIYEVVIPKEEDSDIKYEKPLPFEKLNFKERTDKFHSIGTAFAVGNNRFVSAAHVMSLHLKLDRPYFLRNSQGDVFKVKDVMKYSMSHDAIEFSVEGISPNNSFIPLAEKTEVGDVVFTFGNAQGEGIAIRSGEVANFTPENEDGRWNFIRFSAAASPGNSGGPLLNKKGEVVGVITMKNGNENLNYALPIGEVSKLPDNKAIFQKKNIPFSLLNKTSAAQIDFTVPLPQEFKTAMDLSSAKMKELTKKMYGDFINEHGQSLFPFAPESQNYLRDQAYHFQIRNIDVDGSQEWKIKPIEYKRVNLANDRFLDIWAKDTTVSFVIHKPKDSSLSEFLSKTEMILDEVLKGVNVTRPIGEEKIRILSYGKPHETKLVTDKVGRKWSYSKWHHKNSMKTSTLVCTAVPVGAACNFYEANTGLDNLGSLEYAIAFSHLETLSYYGSFADWKNFVSLEEKFLPTVFVNSKFKYEQDGSFELQTYDSLIKFGKTMDFDKDSILMVKVGLSPQVAFKPEIHGMNIKPRGDKPTQYGYGLIYIPVETMNTDLKKKWGDIIAGKRPFDGVLFSNNNAKHVLMVRKTDGRSVATKGKEDKVYILACSGDTSIPDQDTQSSCSAFFKSISLAK